MWQQIPNSIIMICWGGGDGVVFLLSSFTACMHACFVSVTVKCLVPGVVDGPSWNPFYNYYFTIISGITTGG